MYVYMNITLICLPPISFFLTVYRGNVYGYW